MTISNDTVSFKIQLNVKKREKVYLCGYFEHERIFRYCEKNDKKFDLYHKYVQICTAPSNGNNWSNPIQKKLIPIYCLKGAEKENKLIS